MEALYSRQTYGESLALEIEAMGSTAVAIMNRWALGWPDRVMAMQASDTLLAKLREQTELEKDVLAEETGLKHLSTAEILQMHGVALEAPAPN